MRKSFYTHILRVRKRVALLILLLYSFFGAGIAEGLVLCVSDDGRVAIELDEREFNVGDRDFCSMSMGENDTDSTNENSKDTDLYCIDDSQDDDCESCKDIDISISAIQTILKTTNGLLSNKIFPSTNSVLAVMPVSALALSSKNRFVNNLVEYPHGVNSTLDSLSTIVLIS